MWSSKFGVFMFLPVRAAWAQNPHSITTDKGEVNWEHCLKFLCLCYKECMCQRAFLWQSIFFCSLKEYKRGTFGFFIYMKKWMSLVFQMACLAFQYWWGTVGWGIGTTGTGFGFENWYTIIIHQLLSSPPPHIHIRPLGMVKENSRLISVTSVIYWTHMIC